MSDGKFCAVFVALLLSSAFAFTACIGIVRQGSLRINTGHGSEGTTYVVAPDQNPREYWRHVIGAGAAGTIILILDVWMLARHWRAKGQEE